MLQSFDERNRDLVVGIDDRLVHRDEAGVSPFDSVVQGGDAVWEGLRLYDGRIFKLAEHLARLRRSAPGAGVRRDPVRRARSPSGSGAVLAANEMTDDVHIRLTLTRGVKVTSGMDPRLNQSGPDPDRAGRVQAAGLRRQRDHAGHLVGAPATGPTRSTRRSTTTTCSPRSSPRSRPTSPAPTTR